MRMPNNIKRASAVDLNVSCYSNCRKSGTDTDGSFGGYLTSIESKKSTGFGFVFERPIDASHFSFSTST